MLTKIVETSNIVKTETGAAVLTDGKEEIIDADTPVSMNMWGLTPEFFGILTLLPKPDLFPEDLR